LETAKFTWTGEDPLRGTPRVTLQRETAPNVFADVTRRSGRPVIDQDLLLAWTPIPLVREGTNPRTHYWVVEWQAVSPQGSGDDRLENRASLPQGRYRFHVQGTGYTLDSNPFTVAPTDLLVTATTSASSVSVSAKYNAADGWRLLSLDGDSNRPIPVGSGPATVVLSLRSGGSRTVNNVTLDANGAASIPLQSGESIASVRVTDAFGNTGTVTP
jgi:hypothetical protein